VEVFDVRQGRRAGSALSIVGSSNPTEDRSIFSSSMF
jgi:hypothetical protein